MNRDTNMQAASALTLGTPIHPIPVLDEDYIEEEQGNDPFQHYFDYLVANGKTPADAWDAVWENPARSGTVGLALAAM